MFVIVFLCLFVGVSTGEVVEPSNNVDTPDGGLTNTDLILAFVIFRHGDRTPDEEELELYPDANLDKSVFFPYGEKALTNKGKQRGFLVGEYLRRRYNGFISRLYLPDEISVRTTDYARTKMTALTALAALYPPLPSQKWNAKLNWQPVPYSTNPFAEDDLLYWYNCPRYLFMRNQVYQDPEFQSWLQPYKGLFGYLSENTGSNITTSEDVFFIDNLFQALENIELELPKWAVNKKTEIKEVTKIEYAAEFYNTELIRLAAGVLMADIVNATSAAIAGRNIEPQLRLISAHENNVAAVMAASRVFKPHQPRYGATFSLELRRRRSTGQYGIAAVYAESAGGPEEILQVDGCGGHALCDYDTFLSLTQKYVWTKAELKQECPKLA